VNYNIGISRKVFHFDSTLEKRRSSSSSGSVVAVMVVVVAGSSATSCVVEISSLTRLERETWH